MQLRPFGKSGIKITPLLLGGTVFDWNVDERTSFALLDAFTDAGFNAVDTANSHSRWVTGDKGSESETLIGKWMKVRGGRDRLVVATKFGADMGQGKTVRKDAIPREAEASLNRLQIDCIDLYQTDFGEEAVPVEETLSAYDRLIKDGRVRAFGASSITAARLEVSLAASKSDGLPRYESL